MSETDHFNYCHYTRADITAGPRTGSPAAAPEAYSEAHSEWDIKDFFSGDAIGHDTCCHYTRAGKTAGPRTGSPAAAPEAYSELKDHFSGDAMEHETCCHYTRAGKIAGPRSGSPATAPEAHSERDIKDTENQSFRGEAFVDVLAEDVCHPEADPFHDASDLRVDAPPYYPSHVVYSQFQPTAIPVADFTAMRQQQDRIETKLDELLAALVITSRDRPLPNG